jgi:hypothetical protein
MNNRQRIFLSPSEPDLIGKCYSGAEHVHVICAAPSNFSFSLPDLWSAENVEYIVYNLSTNVGTVTVNGILMSTGETSHTLNPGDTVTFVSDMKSMWLLSDINTVGIYGV